MAGEAPCFNLPIDESVTVYLGLGSNLGDRAANLREALDRMTRIVAIDAVSNVYESEPVGYADQPDFWNLVVRCTTDLPARQLLSELIGIETAMGRARTFRNAPRIIDIDILLYDDVVLKEAGLELPHPRMHERAFVLKPLLDIAPEARDPRSGARYREILERRPLERVAVLGALISSKVI